jgi:DNA invertase Pin-like site-specific DNA recombinase
MAKRDEKISAATILAVHTLHDERIPIDEIAQATKLPKRAIVRLCKGRRKQQRDALVARAEELYPKLRSTFKVAEVLGVSDMTVFLWLRDRGVLVTSKDNHYAPAVRRKAIARVRKGETCAEVARSIGCNRITVKRWWDEANGNPRSQSERTQYVTTLRGRTTVRRELKRRESQSAARRAAKALLK